MNSLLVTLQSIQWREPLWMLLAIQPVVLLILRQLGRLRRLSIYADTSLQEWVVVHSGQPWYLHLFSRNTAYIIAWTLFGIAAAGPRIAQETSDDLASGGQDIMVVVDLSLSMQVTDIQPSRLRRARIELDDLLRRAKGNRIGIIVYAAHPHVYVPLSSDYDALRFYLDSLDKLQLPSNGSNTATALALAQKQLEDNKTTKAIILITDGDMYDLTDRQQRSLEQQVNELSKREIPLYILATGTEEGDAIPARDGGWLTYQGRPVVSRLHDMKLAELAHRSGGTYSTVRDDNSDWNTLYDNGIASRTRALEDPGQGSRIIWHELFTLFMVPGILLFWMAIVPYRYRIQAGKLLTLILAVTLLSSINEPLYAGQQTELEEQAWQAYRNEQYEKAASLYALLGSYHGYMGEAISHYRLSDYPQAMRLFNQAVLTANNDPQRADAVFNLANSYFRSGDYRTAISLYKDTLLYRPLDKQALYNLQFSQVLQNEISTRLADEQAYANRAGRGPRQARLKKDTEIDPAASVSMGEPSEDQDTRPEQPELPDSPLDSDVTFETLLERGMEHLRLAEPGESETGTQQTSTRKLDINSARLHMQQLQDKPVLLWKRLFEIEEAYPAPRDKPVNLPGVQPW